MQISPKPVALWWLRRDLRLTDNQALYAAAQNSGAIIPVFILDPRLWDSPHAGKRRITFLLDGLHQLDLALQHCGSRLILRRGDPVEELKRLVQETGASLIFAEEDYSPYARRRDAAVARQLPLRLMPGLTVRHPLTVLKKDATPYTVFTPFSRAWKALPPPMGTLAAPKPLTTPDNIPTFPFPERPTPSSAAFPAGEVEAQARLTMYTRGETAPIYTYHAQRDRPGLNTTSSLSPYLRFGMISARQAVLAAHEAISNAPNPEARQGAETWLNELIWREFFQAIHYHFPHVHENAFRPELRRIPWADDPADFKAWCQGRTGYPIVDAAMRQLLETGWMHNRTRMIVASFLTKDLLIDWRWGERWFMQHLLDGDPAANNGGWQWAASTGTDAAPYFRVFNPIRQGQTFDPNGAYVRHWLPELTTVPDEYIHLPWEMSETLQHQTACRIGQDYPAPIITHAWARERALSAYRQAQQAFEGYVITS